jgi:glycolate oxidase
MMDKINEMENIRNEIYIATLELGGTITGEHGIGEARIKYINKFIDKTQLKIMLKIKEIFDPNNILNPGKKL